MNKVKLVMTKNIVSYMRLNDESICAVLPVFGQCWNCIHDCCRCSIYVCMFVVILWTCRFAFFLSLSRKFKCYNMIRRRHMNRRTVNGSFNILVSVWTYANFNFEWMCSVLVHCFRSHSVVESCGMKTEGQMMRKWFAANLFFLSFDALCISWFETNLKQIINGNKMWIYSVVIIFRCVFALLLIAAAVLISLDSFFFLFK